MHNSPGLWPKGVLENQSMLFLVIPPYPPAESLGEKCLRPRPGQSASRPLGTTFFQFFSNVFFDLISGCVLVPKTSKSSSKIQLKSYFFTTLGRVVFRAWFGKAKNEKIGVSPTPYAHFRGFMGSKKHSKNRPKIIKKLEKVSWNRFVFLHDKKMNLGTILEGKRDPKINKK